MITINGETWLIKFTQPFDDIFITEDGSRTIGVCDDETKTIYLASSLRGRKLKKVLCHELVHASMFSYDVELVYEQEELLANIIATYGEEIIKNTNDIFERLHN